MLIAQFLLNHCEIMKVIPHSLKSAVTWNTWKLTWFDISLEPEFEEGGCNGKIPSLGTKLRSRERKQCTC